jgi:hypothetical protein
MELKIRIIIGFNPTLGIGAGIAAMRQPPPRYLSRTNADSSRKR